MGLDVARALAIIGMAGAHMGEFGELNIWQPETYLGVAHGRSSILFAVLAGISVAIMTGRGRIPEPSEMPAIRARLFGRGATIFLFGLFCELLGVPVAVILTFYGLLYVAVMPFLRLSGSVLLVFAFVIAMLGPIVTAVLDFSMPGIPAPGAELVIFGAYPLTTWLPLMLVGLAIGRLPLLSTRVAAVVLGLGAVVSAAAYSLSASLGGAEGASVAGPYNSAGESGRSLTDDIVRSVVASYPHSGGTLEVFGSGAFAVAVIGACLLLAKPLRWPLIPIAALGAMPLTAYTAHLVIIVLVWGPGSLPDSNLAWALTSLGLVVGCTVLMALFGRGPLESIVRLASEAMVADRPDPSGSRSSPSGAPRPQ